jgi:microcystin-dependent protein
MDAFIGEIRIFGGNFAPRGWAFCDGSLLRIAQYSTLYSILGAHYGGDGKTTFALPDLRGSTTVGQGAGPGLTPRTVAERGGAASITLLASEMPSHRHALQCGGNSDQQAPGSNTVWSGARRGQGTPYAAASSANTQLAPAVLQLAGGSQAHENMQPYVAMNFIICLDGTYPPRP